MFYEAARVIAVVLLVVGTAGLIAVIWWLLTPPQAIPDNSNSDTLFRGKRCANCMYGSISLKHPLIACDIAGQHQHPDDICKEWR